MGLDMYMHRIKKIDSMTLKEILETDMYVNYLERDEKYSNSSFEDWCGGDINIVRLDKIEDVKANIKTRYPTWDIEKQYGFESISEPVAYWRKANAIHQWFVDNTQDGIDECQTTEITKEHLENLLNVAIEVCQSCELVKGKVINGYKYKDGKRIPIYEDGELIIDSSVAEELLPTTSGFFFGSTEYDQWYLNDIKETIKQITEILNTTDFDNEYVTYCASW